MTMSETAAGGLIRGPAAYVPRTPWGPVRPLAVGLLIVVLSAGVMLASGLLSRLAGPGGLAAGPGRACGARRSGRSPTVLLTLAVSSLLRRRDRATFWRSGPRAAAPASILGHLLADGLSPGLREPCSIHLVPARHVLRPASVRSACSATDWLLALLVVGVGAPLSEELLFRGFLLSALAGRGSASGRGRASRRRCGRRCTPATRRSASSRCS